jgi:hypothetical protein
MTTYSDKLNMIPKNFAKPICYFVICFGGAGGGQKLLKVVAKTVHTTDLDDYVILKSKSILARWIFTEYRTTMESVRR